MYYSKEEIQVLIIACDPDPLVETLKTWTDKVRCISILANGPRSKEIEEVCRQFNKCYVFSGKFLGFSKTRNLLSKYCLFSGLTIFIDDTHHLVGPLLVPKGFDVYSMVIKEEKSEIKYRRNIAFSQSCGKYNGKIHETLITKNKNVFLTNVLLLDKHNFNNELRRAKRIVKDFELLGEDRRGLYYKFCIAVKLSRFEIAERLFNKLSNELDQWLKLSMPFVGMLMSHCLSSFQRLNSQSKKLILEHFELALD